MAGVEVTKADKKAVNDISRSQAQRMLEVVKARQAAGPGHSFSESMSKNTLRQKGRKTAKGGVGGGAEGA